MELAVQTPTQTEYHILMMILERKNYVWKSNDKPTTKKFWDIHKKMTCINITTKSIFYSPTKYYEKHRYKLITLKQYLKLNSITPKELKTIKSQLLIDRI